MDFCQKSDVTGALTHPSVWQRLSRALLTPRTSSATSTVLLPFSLNVAQLHSGWLPSAMLTPSTSSLTVTLRLPSQSPTHRGGPVLVRTETLVLSMLAVTRSGEVVLDQAGGGEAVGTDVGPKLLCILERMPSQLPGGTETSPSRSTVPKLSALAMSMTPSPD